MLSVADDFDHDGWPDVLILESGRDSGAHAGVLYINPQGESRRWDSFIVLPTTQGEASAYGDVDGDGQRDLVVIRENSIGIARPQTDARLPWTYQPVSEIGRLNPHGIGVGDVDGDGRNDILHGAGWYRQPEAPGAPWEFTPAAFGYGAQLYVRDLGAGGLSDVIGALDAHGWGLAWHEQLAPAVFERRLIMGNPAQSAPTQSLATFSQLHAVFVGDINGDGLDDIVTGKRWWAHKDTYRDPDGQGPAVIYAFLQQRTAEGVRFVPHFVGDHVGVGNQIAVADLDGDDRPDIVASARKGTTIYFNRLN
jgi:hypothetical protein